MDAVVVDRVTKTYRLKVGRARVREMLPPPIDRLTSRAFPRWWAKDTFNALENVSFAAPAGSALGLVGHNGAGKTTLLKVIAQVTEPTRGRATVSGRVAALIDAVVGFNSELTGRENVFLLGGMYRFDRREMARRLDRILQFAEIAEDLIDTPVKRFSSGMSARLGFAIIASLDVEVLLIDEVLAVGDAGFQRKCISWLESYRRDGGTLLFVSHNLGLVRDMTDRVVWLDRGRVVDEGATRNVLARYARAMERRDHAGPRPGRPGSGKAIRARGQDRWGVGGANVEEVHFGEPSTNGGGLDVEISYEANQLQKGVFCIGFVDESGTELGAASSPLLALSGRAGIVRCQIHPLPLRTGIYFPVVAIIAEDGVVCDRWKLDRALVIDRDRDSTVTDDFGPLEFASAWSEDS